MLREFSSHFLSHFLVIFSVLLPSLHKFCPYGETWETSERKKLSLLLFWTRGVPWWAQMAGILQSTWSIVRRESSTCQKQYGTRRSWQPCFWGSLPRQSVPSNCRQRAVARSPVNALAPQLGARTWFDDVPRAISHTLCRRQQHLKTKTKNGSTMTIKKRTTLRWTTKIKGKIKSKNDFCLFWMNLKYVPVLMLLTGTWSPWSPPMRFPPKYMP